MSLIVLSNTQEEYEQTGFDGNIITDSHGIQNPASFHNHLTNVFKIPPNSEIALQSLKCSRTAVANVRQNGKVFSIYIGESLGNNKSYQNTSSMPIKCYIGPGIYSVEQLREKIQTALADGVNCHPDYWNQSSVSSHFVLNQFAGYNYNFNCLGPLAGAGGGREPAPNLDNTGAITDSQTPGSWWWRCNTETSDQNGVSTHPGGYLNVVHIPGTGTRLTQGAGGVSDIDCMFQYAKAPLSQMGGYFSFDPFPQDNYQVQWSVGLSRPTTPLRPHPEWCGAEIWDGWQTFYDYVCVWQLNEAGKMALFVYHAVNGDGEYGDELSMEQVKYWQFGGGRPAQIIQWGKGVDAQITEDNFNGAGGYLQISKFRFQVDNENVSLWAEYSQGGFPATWGRVIDPQYYKTPFDDTGGATGAKWDTTFAPTNPNKWYLYPKVALEENLYSIDITDYDHRNADEMKASYPNDVHFEARLSGAGGTSWYGRAIYGEMWHDEIFNRMADMRPANTGIYHSGVNNGLGAYTRKMLETTTGNSECPDYIYAILPASYGGINGLDEDLIGIYSSDAGNSQDILGFANVSQVLNKDYGTRSNRAGNANVGAVPPLPKWVVHSAQRPVMPTASTFLRLTGLTHQSYNFAKSLPSKIIYHFPRFDNQGNNSGPLFYECPEKTYLALNNAEELNITYLKVDVVNLAEEIVGDLQGTTIVVLHIRKR